MSVKITIGCEGETVVEKTCEEAEIGATLQAALGELAAWDEVSIEHID